MPTDAAAAARLRAYSLLEAAQGDAPEDAARRARRAGGPRPRPVTGVDPRGVPRRGRPGRARGRAPRAADVAAAAGRRPRWTRAEPLARPGAARHRPRAARGGRGPSTRTAPRCSPTPAGRWCWSTTSRCPRWTAARALVVCAAAYNALSLWELADELFDLATDLAPACEQPLQQPAVIVEPDAAPAGVGDRAARARRGAPGARPAATRVRARSSARPRRSTCRPLWRARRPGRRATWCRSCSRSCGDRSTARPRSTTRLAALDAHRDGRWRPVDDVEMLPLLDALVALRLVRLGRADEARARLDDAGVPGSSSSGPALVPGLGARPGAVRCRRRTRRWRAHREYGVAGVPRPVGRAPGGARGGPVDDRGTSGCSAEHAEPLPRRAARPADRAVQPSALRPVARRGAGAATRRTALLLIDLDDFKVVNDVHGHAVGDEALRRVARLVASHVRPGDLALRLGGDEFAVLLVEEPDEQTRRRRPVAVCAPPPSSGAGPSGRRSPPPTGSGSPPGWRSASAWASRPPSSGRATPAPRTGSTGWPTQISTRPRQSRTPQRAEPGHDRGVPLGPRLVRCEGMGG